MCLSLHLFPSLPRCSDSADINRSIQTYLRVDTYSLCISPANLLSVCVGGGARKKETAGMIRDKEGRSWIMGDKKEERKTFRVMETITKKE